MKIKHLLIGLFAVAAAVACKQDEPVETPKLEVDKTAVSLAATAGEASFNVTSNQSWVASADADWVSLEPASGQASEKSVAVKVTAEDNETTEARKATVTVKAGELTKTVEVNQAAGAGEQPGPGDEPELPQSEWALVGSFNDWNPKSETYLSVLDEEYFVYYGFELASDTEFKFLKGGVWTPEGQEIGGNGLVEPNTIQPAGGSNIKVTEAGKYDIYLAADLANFYIMSEGKLPSEATEPAPVENQWSMMGCFVDNQWGSDVPMTKEGEWIVAKGAQFTELTFKIRANQSWSDATNIGVAPGSEKGVVNGKVSVVTAEYSKANLGGDAADIKLNGEAGTYDVYFSFENLEVYVMEQGFKPGEKEPVVPQPEDPNELKGDGTEANPYVLKTAEHMVAMRTLAVLGQATYFSMANDIDMASVANWTPVNWDENFEREVHFDGNGKTITNFAPTSFMSDDQTTAAQYPSLFGVLYGSCKNLTIKNSKIIVSETTPSCGFLGGYVGTAGKPAVVENVSVQGEVYGGSCVGALAGQSNGPTTYKNCTVDAVLTAAGTDLGGIVGKIRGDSELTGCTVKAIMVSTAINKNRVGGLIGWNSTATTTITDCHVLEGTTLTDKSGRTASDNGNYGGLIGFGDTSNTVLKISDCSAHTVIDAGISTYNACFIGGTGYDSTTEITDSWAAGSVIGANYSAGFVGAVQNRLTASRCWADVDVTSSGQRSGAFLGCSTKFPITVSDCYSTGDITATGQQVGGIIGYASFPVTITNCYAAGNVTSATAGTGGIAGTISAESTVSNCIAWNATIDCQRTANDKWAPGAVVGAASVAGSYSGCYRRADMNLIDAAGAMVLVDHEDVANGLPAAPSYSEETTQAAYHGKAAAADATVSSVAKALGWDESVWNLSGDLPKLK